MKFITENDLRDLNRKEPFTNYEIEPGARLTPGARQFLSDRGINMYDNDPYTKKNTVNVKQAPAIPEIVNTWKKKKLRSKMKSTEALFLLYEEELLSGDASLAQSVINLGKQFSCIKNHVDGKGPVENLNLTECTGIKVDNFSDDLDDCFEITESHMQLKQGRKIIILHRLRCDLREIEPVVLEVYEGSDKDKDLCSEVISKVNQIINTLSQIICSVLGGKECQRKS
ncbi:ethanolamine utilization protein [Clostridium estertheticum]|uniref:ethanolamine utilization protein n=1 Tax=Clostridium estertheticum TaxID=238834 RepID=UPI0013E92FDA|nr:ethanolamine utilization protein [Clostridium estertheticum]MBZ9685808.1 ethanolamine utilization protein [Clostridium estertheticum]